MDFLKSLLGLVVLSSPLWLILLMVPLSIVTAILVTKRLRNVATKIVAFVTVMISFFLVLFGDEIAGRLYLNHLCETKAGVKVYQTVELPAEYWDERGDAKFIKGIGSLNTDVITNYDADVDLVSVKSLFPIEKYRFWYFEKKSGQVLGEMIDFHFKGGWLMRNFSPSRGGGASCKIAGLKDSKKILLSIFHRAEK